VNRRVVITGMGAVTPLGVGAAATWDSLVAGRSGVRQLTTFDASTFPVRIGGEVTGFNFRASAPRSCLRHLNRAGEFGMGAAFEAVHSAGITPQTYPPEERGVAMGGSVGRPELQELVDLAHLHAAGSDARVIRRSPGDSLLRDQPTTAAAIARMASCHGPVITVSTACSGSCHAVGEAFRMVQEGDAPMMIAGGTDSLTTWVDMLGFGLLGALTKDYNDAPERGSRPFAGDRSGFVIGEGAVVFVLEDMESARARGATVLAEILGYGSTLNGYRITDSPPDGRGAIQVMEHALAESGLGTGDIDLIVAHGTGTPGNDASETVAIKEVFGPDAYNLVVSAPKSMAGHLTSASAALGLLTAVGAIRHSVVPPTINLDVPDPKLDLDYVPNVARQMPVSAAMVNAFAFGGTNACLVVGRPEEDT
jgi:3-oxoacyl-[acyl-carrier-protein] synthase II